MKTKYFKLRAFGDTDIKAPSESGYRALKGGYVMFENKHDDSCLLTVEGRGSDTGNQESIVRFKGFPGIEFAISGEHSDELTIYTLCSYEADLLADAFRLAADYIEATCRGTDWEEYGTHKK